MEHTKLPLSDEIPYKSSSMTRKGAYVALSYMVSSVLLIIFNKAALSSYRFPFTSMACAFVILYVLKSMMIISFTTAESKSSSYNPVMFVPSRTLAQTLPLALPYLLYVVVTMEAVRGINVPMYTTLRRTTIAFTMMMEYFIGGKRHSNIVIISVGVIIFGAFIAGARDLAFDSYGYSIVFIENMCKAVYLTSVSRVGKSTGLNVFGLMWCNVVLCGPILLLWSAFRGELQSTLKFPYLLFPGFQALIFLSCAFTFFMNYIVVLNTTINSALTQAICSNLKDVFTSGFGWLLFGGLPYDLFNVLGQSIGFLGSCLYAYCKTRGK
ncbi:UDP-N-acetylglucosamine transporter UGNT1-like isoform X2 [Arachis duranensis]|uniref:UDP-N-acetylglucosamine transporter UGNT1-like isoform X2 n=1 Tax=Arachis duranensis TaxID=130453 RepID=A0A6P4CYD8_ARADU|nr:UDP-N-acetylglucosamine transporter UGNT1-like isoform X2 [Arachis duranensis]